MNGACRPVAFAETIIQWSVIITVTTQSAPWRLKSPAFGLFSKSFFSVAHQRKYQRYASLAFVRGIHQWPVDSSRKGPVTREMLPFADVIMCGEATATHSRPDYSQLDPVKPGTPFIDMDHNPSMDK